MKHIQIISDAFEIYGKQYRSLGDYSATTLIDPPRKVALTKRYGHLVTPTVDSQAASLVGTAVHEKMERLLRLSNVKNPDYMLERSVVHPMGVTEADGVPNFRLLAGRFDILYKEKDMYDIKTAKTWKLVFNPDMKDWHEQQNIYAYLLRMRGIKVESLNILCFYLDWIESSALRDSKYPQAPIVQYELTKWPLEETQAFIEGRLNWHVTCESMPDTNLPECSGEEMWEREPEFAIKKTADAKRAMRVVKKGTFEDAVTMARSLSGVGPESVIEARHGIRKRCENYCSVNEYCNQYKKYADKKSSTGLNTIYPLGGLL
jgi:hypothetical protein